MTFYDFNLNCAFQLLRAERLIRSREKLESNTHEAQWILSVIRAYSMLSTSPQCKALSALNQVVFFSSSSHLVLFSFELSTSFPI